MVGSGANKMTRTYWNKDYHTDNETSLEGRWLWVLPGELGITWARYSGFWNRILRGRSLNRNSVGAFLFGLQPWFLLVFLLSIAVGPGGWEVGSSEGMPIYALGRGI